MENVLEETVDSTGGMGLNPRTQPLPSTPPIFPTVHARFRSPSTG